MSCTYVTLAKCAQLLDGSTPRCHQREYDHGGIATCWISRENVSDVSEQRRKMCKLKLTLEDANVVRNDGRSSVLHIDGFTASSAAESAQVSSDM